MLLIMLLTTIAAALPIFCRDHVAQNTTRNEMPVIRILDITLEAVKYCLHNSFFILVSVLVSLPCSIHHQGRSGSGSDETHDDGESRPRPSRITVTPTSLHALDHLTVTGKTTSATEGYADTSPPRQTNQETGTTGWRAAAWAGSLRGIGTFPENVGRGFRQLGTRLTGAEQGYCLRGRLEVEVDLVRSFREPL
jgi:hypothetical protein